MRTGRHEESEVEDQIHSNEFACCQSLPAQPVACCHVGGDLLETMMIQKDSQNFPAIPTQEKYLFIV